MLGIYTNKTPTVPSSIRHLDVFWAFSEATTIPWKLGKGPKPSRAILQDVCCHRVPLISMLRAPLQLWPSGEIFCKTFFGCSLICGLPAPARQPDTAGCSLKVSPCPVIVSPALLGPCLSLVFLLLFSFFPLSPPPGLLLRQIN